MIIVSALLGVLFGASAVKYAGAEEKLACYAIHSPGLDQPTNIIQILGKSADGTLTFISAQEKSQGIATEEVEKGLAEGMLVKVSCPASLN